MALDSEKILKDLHAQWDELDRQNAETGGVLRACSLTLMVTAADREDAAELRHTLGAVVRDHPLRAIVLRMEAEGGTEAHVFSECWLPSGGGQSVCSEGVELGTDQGNLEETAPILLALRQADLPVVLCCRGPGAFSLRAYDALFPLADKIILDSSKVPGANAALAFLRSLRGRGYRVADLHWTRISGWRQVLGDLFDDEAMTAEDVTAARVVHGGESVSTCALYFATWIGKALPGARVSLEKTTGSRGLQAVTLSTGKGDLSLTKAGKGLVEVSGPGRRYRATLRATNEEALLREELSILGTDAVYDRVLG